MATGACSGLPATHSDNAPITLLRDANKTLVGIVSLGLPPTYLSSHRSSVDHCCMPAHHCRPYPTIEPYAPNLATDSPLFLNLAVPFLQSRNVRRRKDQHRPGIQGTYSQGASRYRRRSSFGGCAKRKEMRPLALPPKTLGSTGHYSRPRHNSCYFIIFYGQRASISISDAPAVAIRHLGARIFFFRLSPPQETPASSFACSCPE